MAKAKTQPATADVTDQDTASTPPPAPPVQERQQSPEADQKRRELTLRLRGMRLVTFNLEKNGTGASKIAECRKIEKSVAAEVKEVGGEAEVKDVETSAAKAIQKQGAEELVAKLAESGVVNEVTLGKARDIISQLFPET